MDRTAQASYDTARFRSFGGNSPGTERVSPPTSPEIGGLCCRYLGVWDNAGRHVLGKPLEVDRPGAFLVNNRLELLHLFLGKTVLRTSHTVRGGGYWVSGTAATHCHPQSAAVVTTHATRPHQRVKQTNHQKKRGGKGSARGFSLSVADPQPNHPMHGKNHKTRFGGFFSAPSTPNERNRGISRRAGPAVVRLVLRHADIGP